MEQKRDKPGSGDLDPEEVKGMVKAQQSRFAGPSRGARPAAASDEPAAPRVMAEHTVAAGDTLGAIALKYYGSAAKEKWMVIYEANRDVIGDNPSLIRPGQVLKIPENK